MPKEKSKEEIWVDWLESAEKSPRDTPLTMPVSKTLDFDEVIRLVKNSNKIILRSYNKGKRIIYYSPRN